MTPGDVVQIKCKTHGETQLIAGIHFSINEPAPEECPFCLRTMLTGKNLCGEGYIDERGVAYIVDIQGNLRKLQGLSPQQQERIKEKRKFLRKEEK